VLWRLLVLIRFLTTKNDRVSNFTDQYANGYLYLTGVFYGSLTPNNSALATIPNVPYRHVSKDRSNIDWAGSIGLSANQQVYEVWTAPLNGYVPSIGDIFADAAGIGPWQVLDVKSSDLVGSNGLPVNVQILAQRAK
jgi:hypothetical protein